MMNKYDGFLYALTFLLIVLLTFCLIDEEQKPQEITIIKNQKKGEVNATTK